MEEKKTGLTVLREALGYSVQQFAEELDVSRATVWKWTKELPDMIQRRICLKFGLPSDIDLGGPLTEEQEKILYKCAWDYLMSDHRPARGKVAMRKNTFFDGAITITNSTDYVLEIDRVLTTVKNAFLRDESSKDARIRIMVDALQLKMDEWKQQNGADE